MKTRLIHSVVLLVLSATAASASDERLASAKVLYESASYESALNELGAIQGDADADAVDTYRALCLLGLGRAADAERVLVGMVSRRPLLTLSDAEYSPRLIALFGQIRQRTLPGLAQQYYTAAKADFDDAKYEVASAGFQQTLDVIAAVSAPTDALKDLRLLAEGFAALAATKKQPAVPALPDPAAPPPAPASAIVYTALDASVTPPVAIDQKMPAWHAGIGPVQRTFRGQMELIIDETGAVKSAAIIESLWRPYDVLLMKAYKGWRYQPALKDGKPVSFRRLLDIVITPNADTAPMTR